MDKTGGAGDRHTQAYAEAYASFRLDDVEALFDGSFTDGINACVECCDRHAGSGRIALDWENAAGERRQLTFEEMKELSARFAGFLAAHGIRPGDVVAGMLPRTPDLLAVILGTWRAGAVYQPLFTAFGPKAIEHRLQMSSAKLVVTDTANRGKLDEVPGAPPVAVVSGGEPVREGDFNLPAELERQSGEFPPVMRHGDDLFMMMSTSGTTGMPKGVPVPLRAMPAFYVYMRDAVDLRPDDTFWNIADPGWAYGLYYAVAGPLMLGCKTTFFDGPFSVESTYRMIETHGITNLAGAPTAYRLMIAAGAEAAGRAKGRLRVVSSAGEPLNPEVIIWFRKHLDAPIYDHYGQTEMGMVANTHHRLVHPVHPGSTGFAPEFDSYGGK